MEFTLIIAVTGLVLSLINTITTIYKEFIKKDPTPDVYCDYVYWRYGENEDKTQYQIQIDLTVVPIIQANMVKENYFY